MRILILALLLLASPGWGVTLACDLPTAAVSDAGAACEKLRQDLRVSSSAWSNDLCATELARRGLRQYHRAIENNANQATADAATSAAMDLFDTNFPLPYTPAYCGDGTWDEEFGEGCDDGNNENGDGCDASCNVE